MTVKEQIRKMIEALPDDLPETALSETESLVRRCREDPATAVTADGQRARSGVMDGGSGTNAIDLLQSSYLIEDEAAVRAYLARFDYLLEPLVDAAQAIRAICQPRSLSLEHVRDPDESDEQLFIVFRAGKTPEEVMGLELRAIREWSLAQALPVRLRLGIAGRADV